MFLGSRTGVIVTRSMTPQSTSQYTLGNDFDDSSTSSVTTVYNNIVFLEPVTGETRSVFLSEFGLENGRLYVAFFDKNDDIKENDSLSFNPDTLYQNAPYNESLPSISLTVKKVMKGAFSAGRLEVYCYTS